MIPSMKAAFLELEKEEQKLNNELGNLERELLKLHDREHTIRTALTHLMIKRTRMEQATNGTPQ